MRQHLVEGMLLWTLGGAAAVALVLFLRSTVDIGSFVGIGGLGMTPPIDWRVLAFTGAVSLVVGLLFSIDPAIRATRADPAETLRSATPAATPNACSPAHRWPFFQLSASLTLLVGAFLLAATLMNLARVPLGFDPDGVFGFFVQPSSVGYAEPASREYLNDFQRRLRQVAGVRSVAAADGAPFFGGANHVRRVQPGGADAAQAYETYSNVVFSPDYFTTLAVPLIGGRLFTDADFAAAQRGESRLAVVSEGLARKLFGRPGRRRPANRVPEPATQRPVVTRSSASSGRRGADSLVEAPEDMVYEPAGPRSMRRGATVIVRTSGSVPLAEQARAIATALNPSLPVSPVLSMADAVARSRAEWVLPGAPARNPRDRRGDTGVRRAVWRDRPWRGAAPARVRHPAGARRHARGSVPARAASNHGHHGRGPRARSCRSLRVRPGLEHAPRRREAPTIPSSGRWPESLVTGRGGRSGVAPSVPLAAPCGSTSTRRSGRAAIGEGQRAAT